jgi:large subunit ribosomal protein L21
MFAVIKTGGKQYRVQENTTLRIEKLEIEPGETVSFNDILMISAKGKVTLGSPFVAGATVEGTVIDQMRDRKVIVFKKKRRHNYRRKKGHRQHLTVVHIQKISHKA